MRQRKLTPTTKTVDSIVELHRNGRLDLTPDFQRNSVWPPSARAYLVDTILNDLPIPLIFLAQERDLNTNRLKYRVIDGQQRIRAAIGFASNRQSIPNNYGVVDSKGKLRTRIRYRDLPEDLKDQFTSYPFVVTELSGFTEEELRDIFVRINKYVVRLNRQELREAEQEGPFSLFVSSLAENKVWEDLDLFSARHTSRKRDREYLAELAILLLEGAQDKKGSIELYYRADDDQFDELAEVGASIIKAATLAHNILAQQTSDDSARLFRRLPVFYSLMGALFELIEEQEDLAFLGSHQTAERIGKFAADVEALSSLEPSKLEAEAASSADPDAYRFQLANSSQTDNIRPRMVRIEVLKAVLAPGTGDSDA